MSLRLHSEAEYQESVEYHAIVAEGCRILGCGPDDLVRMTDGLVRSNEMLERLKNGLPVSDEEIQSLPKRWRKPFKRLKARR